MIVGRCEKKKKFLRSILAPETSRNCLDHLSTLKDNCSALDKPRELKLEPPENEDSEHVFKIFLASL
jgi:hypothetical protein